jgi:hypothetical protein
MSPFLTVIFYLYRLWYKKTMQTCWRGMQVKESIAGHARWRLDPAAFYLPLSLFSGAHHSAAIAFWKGKSTPCLY